MEQGKKEIKRILVTFDVDGTLIQSDGTNSNHFFQAFSYAILQVFGIHGTINVIQPHGSTDPAILVNTLVHYGISSEVATEKLPILMSKMTEYAKAHAEDLGKGLEVLPGVESLLQTLSSMDNVIIGLVTGNLEETAWMKLDALGIKKYFSVPHFGGFGSDHMDRGHLIKIAAERAENLYPGKFDSRLHVGDTPNDIIAAECEGALAIGVCTGVFRKEELEQVSNRGAVILQDLCDHKSFINLLVI
ncbi:uncharacterized protein LOC110710181 [Chenopodium quinoa]|uniref:Uncharacterized protein n=1 Tax=Chenopodium quinoa TaxID=63459 RepID=A0A803L107_CHEQI|nr:uncharacterized protein LOC110710181 [Chenopodium quinoa]XP_021744149.1 uncharacterized protein LOC110710181 [Chenopodium quinoa]XP_021744157.1 uncharacterized protein LOC110710181 [Chenopodium quinoa]XP_021744164.1 uncharacterized protein LOC110710181 [Chenopodium quinoa]